MSSMTAKAFTQQLETLAQESATLMDEGRQQWSVDSIVYRSALDYAHKIAITRHHAVFFRPNAGGLRGRAAADYEGSGCHVSDLFLFPCLPGDHLRQPALAGRRAGPLRSRQMLAGGVDAVYAFRLPGSSPGTDDMIRIARAARVPVKIVTSPS